MEIVLMSIQKNKYFKMTKNPRLAENSLPTQGE